MQELTERQSTIIRLIADGYTVKEIAFTLSLKVITVRKHIMRIVYKLGAKTTCHAAAIFTKQAAQEYNKPVKQDNRRQLKEDTAMIETVQEVQEKQAAIEQECKNLVSHLETQLAYANENNMTADYRAKLEGEIEKAKAANNATLADLGARLAQAQERESKETAARQAEDAARVASNKAIMKAELQSAWISEGGSAADFEVAFDELYRAEMIRRALARSRGDTAKGRQAVKDAMR